MKKGVMLSVLFIFILSTLTIVSAQTNLTTESEKIQDAYSCLNDKVSGKCAALSTEEKIFSLLALGECRSELLSSSINNECWSSSGSSSCKLKPTAQAILALGDSGSSQAQNWLISQNRTASELLWYLQIDSSNSTACSIGYSGLSYSFSINEDKTLTGNPGPGLSISEGGYWLQVSPNFYNTELSVSCDKDFLTSLLFRESSSSTLHIFPESSSASAGGTTKEKVESYCFSEGNSCNYEGSLWVAFVLDSLGEDVSPFLPYIITFSEDNSRFLPDSFLYSILQNPEYRASLLSKQIGSKWWAVSGDRFYDTALALYPFSSETFTEKTNSEQWLLDEQGLDGCWSSGSIRNTAFILSSVWPSASRTGGSGGSGGSGGTTGGVNGSGTTPAVFTCSELSGDLCSSNQICSRGSLVSSADSVGENCCIGGFCQAPSGDSETLLSECEQQGGICRSGVGLSSEERASYPCTFGGDTCYISQSSPERSLAWVWILVVLIVLVIIGIIFKDSLRHLWLKTKFSFGKTGPSHEGPPGYNFGRPPFPPSHYTHGPSPPRYHERRILPTPQPRPHSMPQPQKKPDKPTASKELDEVLKKLKEMSG